MENTETMKKHPDADAAMKRVHGVLLDVSRLAGCTPTSVGESPQWIKITQHSVETRKNLHQHLEGKALYSALFGVYTEVLRGLKGVLQDSATTRGAENPASELETTSLNEDFREQRRCKRNPSDGQASKPKKPSAPATSVNDPRLWQQQEVPTKNFFAPLQTTAMECEGGKTQDTEEDKVQQGPGNKTGRPLPLCLPLQKKLDCNAEEA
jgi:hypothetical protein